MNDQDYIRKAVELADGWQCHSSFVIISAPLQNTEIEDLGRCHKDALAAQLTRQVESSGDYYVAQYGDGRTSVNQFSGGLQLSTSIRPKDISVADRTMSTIKAIVDSGTLS